MEVELVQAPQDGSADTVLHLALAPSYITYNAASIKRVSDFFASQKVPHPPQSLGLVLALSCILAMPALTLARPALSCSTSLTPSQAMHQMGSGLTCMALFGASPPFTQPCNKVAEPAMLLRQAPELGPGSAESVTQRMSRIPTQVLQQQPCQHSNSWAWLQVVDLSVLGAQAIAQVERARKTAAASLAAAMKHRPKLLLTASLRAPKIAIPVPAEDGQGGRRCCAMRSPCNTIGLLHLSAALRFYMPWVIRKTGIPALSALS